MNHILCLSLCFVCRNDISLLNSVLFSSMLFFHQRTWGSGRNRAFCSAAPLCTQGRISLFHSLLCSTLSTSAPMAFPIALASCASTKESTPSSAVLPQTSLHCERTVRNCPASEGCLGLLTLLRSHAACAALKSYLVWDICWAVPTHFLKCTH